MDTPSEDTKAALAAERYEKHRKRQRHFEYMLGQLGERLIGIGMFMYRAIEDIKGRVEQMEVNLTQLEDTMEALEEEDTAIATAVQTAGERFTELTKELEGLNPGGTITQEQIDKLETKAKGTLDGLTQAGEALTKETPAASGGGGGTPAAKPTKSVYLFAGGTPAEPPWSASGFETVPGPEEQPKKLYYFDGDAENTTEANGADTEWTVYTGDVQQVSQSA